MTKSLVRSKTYTLCLALSMRYGVIGYQIILGTFSMWYFGNFIRQCKIGYADIVFMIDNDPKHRQKLVNTIFYEKLFLSYLIRLMRN